MQKTNKKEFRDEKVIKGKRDKLYLNMDFNSWIDKEYKRTNDQIFSITKIFQRKGEN